MPDIDYSKYPNVNFRLGEHLDSALSARGDNKNSVAKRDLERYYALLPSLVPTLSEDQVLFLCSVFNGSRNINPETLWDEVADAVQGEQKLVFVDVAQLLARIDSLSTGERIALADAIERYWSGGEYHRSEETSKIMLRRVGLVK